MNPVTAHMIKQSPKDPEYLRTGVGETKIPEPIIRLMIRLLAENRPTWRFSSTGVLIFSKTKKSNSNKIVLVFGLCRKVSEKICLNYISQFYMAFPFRIDFLVSVKISRI